MNSCTGSPYDPMSMDQKFVPRVGFNKMAGRLSKTFSNDYKKELKESTGPFFYRTDQHRYLPLTDCNQFIPGIGMQHRQNQGILRSRVDIESELKDITRMSSKCPSKKFSPINALQQSLNCGNCPNCDKGLPCGCLHCRRKNQVNRIECEKQIPEPAQERNMRIKPCNLPGVYINRFEALCENPQDVNRIHSNNYIGAGTRNEIKDNFAYLTNFKQTARKIKLPSKKCCKAGKLGCKHL